MKGIEFQFCSSWSGWDEINIFCLQFYDAVLLPEVAFLVGVSVVEVMTVDMETSTVTFYISEGVEKTFNLVAKIGDPV